MGPATPMRQSAAGIAATKPMNSGPPGQVGALDQCDHEAAGGRRVAVDAVRLRSQCGATRKPASSARIGHISPGASSAPPAARRRRSRRVDARGRVAGIRAQAPVTAIGASKQQRQTRPSRPAEVSLRAETPAPGRNRGVTLVTHARTEGGMNRARGAYDAARPTRCTGVAGAERAGEAGVNILGFQIFRGSSGDRRAGARRRRSIGRASPPWWSRGRGEWR